MRPKKPWKNVGLDNIDIVAGAVDALCVERGKVTIRPSLLRNDVLVIHIDGQNLAIEGHYQEGK